MANTFNLGDGNWATKEDSLLGYNSENNNYKPLPFDFSRASSATRVNKDGLIETVGNNVPRIDYKDDSKGALLLEPSRSNIITYSEDFSQNSWTKTNSTISSNQDISPDGTNNASLFSAVGEGRLRINFSPPSTERSFSIWVKSYNNTQSNGLLTFSGLNSISFTTTNEWQRITTTRDVAGDTFKCSLRTTDSSLLVWGAQLEQGSYATSYIPTQGGAVTRLADSCNNAGNEQVINSTEGVLYAEISALESGGVNRYISLSDNTTSNRIQLVLSGSNANRISVSGSGLTSINYDSYNQTDMNKVALKYSTSGVKLFVNGLEVGSNNDNATWPSGTFTTLDFALWNQSSVPFYGKVKDLKLYSTALTDQELQALTTI